MIYEYIGCFDHVNEVHDLTSQISSISVPTASFGTPCEDQISTWSSPGDCNDAVIMPVNVLNNGECALRNSSDAVVIPVNAPDNVGCAGGCKRIHNASAWKRNKRKCLLNSGRAYTNVKGDTVHSKNFSSVKNPCCKSKCSSRISTSEAEHIFTEFWSLGNHDSQNVFIAGCVTESGVATHTVSSSQDYRKMRNRSFVRKYVVKLGNQSVAMCKAMFLSLLGISSGRVNNVLKNARLHTGVVRADQRGTHKSHRCIPNSSTQLVEAHIRSFPVNESHYTRSHSNNRRFLSSELSVSKMYRLYLEQMCDKKCTPVKEWYYKHIFNTRFNLSFHSPKKDTCKRCDVFKVQFDAENDKSKKLQLQAEHELHLRKAESARNSLKQDHEVREGHEAITFDLQKVMSFPHVTSNEVYYSRQLSAFNFGIHSLTSNKAAMYVWDETVASRGPEEIGSCIVAYCHKKADDGVRFITAYSDSCGGQNRNHKLVLIWMHICMTTFIEKIDHKFLVSGHSFLPNDADFGVIERTTKKSALYVPDQWYNAIRSCKRSNPFEVVEMKQEAFVSVASLLKHAVIRKKSTDGSKLEWLKIQWIQIRQQEPMKMYYKYTCQDDVPFSCIDFARRDRPVAPGNHLLPLYNRPRNLSVEKAADIQKLMKFVPPVYHTFYSSRCLCLDDEVQS